MIKRLLSVILGAALALEFQRWWERRRERLRVGALTGSLLDKLNAQLESRRAGR
jgi:hypothetical protein